MKYQIVNRGWWWVPYDNENPWTLLYRYVFIDDGYIRTLYNLPAEGAD